MLLSVLPASHWRSEGSSISSFLPNDGIGFCVQGTTKKKCGDFEELANGSDHEDKCWLLTDLVATKDEISCNEDCCSKYYDSYYVVLN